MQRTKRISAYIIYFISYVQFQIHQHSSFCRAIVQLIYWILIPTDCYYWINIVGFFIWRSVYTGFLLNSGFFIWRSVYTRFLLNSGFFIWRSVYTGFQLVNIEKESEHRSQFTMKVGLCNYFGKFEIIWLSNILTLRVPDEGHSRNA
jgi:hypothetical protein